MLRRVLFALLLLSCSNHKSQIHFSNTNTLQTFEDSKDILLSWSNKNQIVFHVISEPDNLHLTNGSSIPRSEILQYTQRPLLYIDYDSLKIIPGLVKKLPDISPDGLHYTYELRDNILWDDGKLLTTEDIIFTAKAFACPLTNDPSVRFYWQNIKDILVDPDKPGKFTIVMMKKNIQNISFLSSFSIMERAYHDKKNTLSGYSLAQFADTAFNGGNSDLQEWSKEFNDDKYGRDPALMNGLGMYKVSEWSAGQYITLVRKTNHWSHTSGEYHEVSFPEKIIFKLNRDEAAQVLEFRSQTMDASTNLPVESFFHISDDPEALKNYNAVMMPTFNYTYICINELPDGVKRKRLFVDPRTRRAIAMATPVKDIIRLVYKNFSGQCHRMISNVSPLKNEFNAGLKEIPYDIPQAEKLLKEAGWTDNDGDGILDKIVGTEKIKLEADLNYLSTSPEWKNIALLLVESMAKAGIRINPVAMELKLFSERARAHDFDLILGAWSSTGLPEDYTQLWHTGSWKNHGSNYSGFGNAVTDRLIEEIKGELNDSARVALSHRLQEEIYADQPYVFLYSSMRRNVIHRRFANQVVFSERPGILLNMLRLLSINNGITITGEVSP